MIPSYTGHVSDQPTRERLSFHTASVLAVRACVLVCPLLVVLSTSVASGEFNVPVVLVVVVGAWASARVPDSHLPTLLTIALGAQWVARVESITSGWSLAAAAALGAFHASTALSTAIPPGARVPTATVRRWSVRTLALLLCSLVVWIAVVLAHRNPLPGSSALLAVTLTSISIVTLAARASASGAASDIAASIDDQP